MVKKGFMPEIISPVKINPFAGFEIQPDDNDKEKLISPIDINYLRSQAYESQAPKIEEELPNGSNYKRYIASYASEGNKIYGLLTVPIEKEGVEPPKNGYSAVVFNHGYIPPSQYSTTEKYEIYVDYLAKSGFVVFKIDLRGHGKSEGTARGSYFSPGYTIDAISALKSLQKLDYVNPDKIGMWGHSMAGNLVLRAMLVSDDVKAGVIWAGAVYSYKDFAEYRLNDQSYVGRREEQIKEETEEKEQEKEKTEAEKQKEQEQEEKEENLRKEISVLREDEDAIDFESNYWKGLSLTENLNFLKSPLQVHHAQDDPVVNIGYSRDLRKVLEEQGFVEGEDFEIYEYTGGGHNINSPYFETAMKRTVEFFNENL